MPALLPTLFDRLCDDAPHNASEPPAAYTLTLDGLRENVRRELGFLLNTANLAQTVNFTPYPAAGASCLNFGVPPLVGNALDANRPELLDLFIRDAIRRFEPRLDPATLQVDFLAADPQGNRSHAPTFQIRALIVAQPYPLEFTVQSAVDFESGRIASVVCV